MDPHRTAVSAVPLPQVRACAYCARSKARCVPGNDINSKCQRCHRLDKECVAASPTRKPRAPRALGGSRVAQLEEKLESLVTLLKSSQQPGPSDLTELPVPSAAGALKSPASTVLPLEFRTLGQKRTLKDNQPPFVQFSDQYPTPESQYSSHVELSNEEATAVLEIFRTEMVGFFPFCPIPASMTPEVLQKERPFFYSCLIAFHYRDPDLQRIYSQELLAYFGDRVLIKAEKSMDLLLGILAYVGWCHFHFYGSPNLNNILSLATALVWDLELHRPPREDQTVVEEALRYSAYGSMLSVEQNKRTLEERRAMLGVFFFNSVNSRSFQKREPVQWTPYIDECVRVLCENAEYPTDKTIEHLINLQRIRERIFQIPCHDSLDSLGCSVPAGPFIKSLQRQLRDFRRDLPAEFEQNIPIMLHYHSVEISVHEIGLVKWPAGNPETNDFLQLEALYNCLNATKSFFDVWFTMPSLMCLRYSVYTALQLAQAIIASLKLAFFEHPDWDLQDIRQKMDLSSILDQLTQRLNEVKSIMDPEVEESSMKDVFSQLARKMGRFKHYYDIKTATSMRQSETATDVQNMDVTTTSDSIDMMDDGWLKDFLGPWSDQFHQYMPQF